MAENVSGRGFASPLDRGRRRLARLSASVPLWIGLAILNSAGAQARGRLEIAREVREGGRGGAWFIVGVIAVFVLVALLQSYFWQVLARASRSAGTRGGPLAGNASISPVRPVSQTGSAPGAASPLPAGGVADMRTRGSTDATDSPGVTRCPRCYGKYNSQTDKSCPYCAQEKRRTEDELQRLRSAGAVRPAAATGPVAAEEGPGTKFQEAEEFNEQGVKLLKNIAPIFRVDDAIKKFNEAIKRAPRNASYYSNRGVAHFTNARRRFSVIGKREDPVFQRDIQAAIEDFTKAIELRNSHANYIIWRAQAYEFLGDSPHATVDYERVLYLEPAHAGAQEAMERLRREEAALGVTGARALAQRLTTEGMRIATEGDPDRGIEYLDSAIEADPAYSPAYLAKAELLNKLNRMEESMATFEKAMEANQRDIQSLLGSYQQKGLTLKKIEQVDEAAEFASGEDASAAPPLQEAGGRGKGVTGSLSEMALPDILQVLAAGMKTVRINVASHERAGTIVLGEGHIVDAYVEDLRGEDAFYEVLTWMEGDFTVEPLLESPEQTIYHPNDALILEGLRRMDEAARDLGEGTSGEGT